MANFNARSYSISDFLEWSKNKQLELSPKFQRRPVWRDSARSYLIDTVIRGKPIPKIFIRQKLNPTTYVTIREVVDGQQRLRAILDFLSDGFQIARKHNKSYANFYYSQLPQEVQTSILKYEISTDLLIDMPDSEILDIFGRLNSYSVVLNQQEKINATHFSVFKLLADDLGHRYVDFWVENKILTNNQIARMGDAAMAADLLIACVEGVKNRKQVKTYYAQYEKNFPYSLDELEDKFVRTLVDVDNVFADKDLRESQFRRPHLFYTLFTVLYQLHWGLKDFDGPRLADLNYARIRSALIPAEEAFTTEDPATLDSAQQQFLKDSRNATTDGTVRLRRTRYLLDLIAGTEDHAANANPQ